MALSLAQRRAKAALQLRIEGRTFDEIASQLQLAGASSAKKAYDRGIREAALLDLTQTEWRDLSVYRTEQRYEALLRLAEQNQDLGAYREAGRAQRDLERLLGLVVPAGRMAPPGGHSPATDDEEIDATVVTEGRVAQLRKAREDRDAARRSASH